MSRERAARQRAPIPFPNANPIRPKPAAQMKFHFFTSQNYPFSQPLRQNSRSPSAPLDANLQPDSS